MEGREEGRDERNDGNEATSERNRDESTIGECDAEGRKQKVPGQKEKRMQLLQKGRPFEGKVPEKARRQQETGQERPYCVQPHASRTTCANDKRGSRNSQRQGPRNNWTRESCT